MKKRVIAVLISAILALPAIISICSSSSRWNDRRKQNTSGTKRGMGCMV